MARGIVTGTVFRRRSFDYTSVRDLSVIARKPKSEETGVPNLYEQVSEVSSKLKGDVHYALASDRTLLRVVEFPSDDPEEIEGMVDLQLEKIAPFPVDHMYVSHEVLHQGDGASRVLIAATQRKWVDHAGDSFAEAGISLRRIDVDVLGWLHMLRRDQRIPEEGRHLILFLDEAGTELVLVEGGQPLAFRSLGVQDEDESEADFLAEVAEEFEYSMAAFEGEWGGQPVESLTVWHWGAAPERIGQLGESAGVLLQTESFETLGSLSEGIALRAARAAEDKLLDLAPADWIETIKTKAARRSMILAGLGLVALLLLYTMGLMIFRRSLENKSAERVAEIAAQEAPVAEVQKLSKDVRFLRGFTDRSSSGLEALDHLTTVMPVGIEISSVSYERDEKDDREITQLKIKGTAASRQTVLDWSGALSQSGFFTIAPPTTKPNKYNQDKIDFSFDAVIRGEDA